MLGVKSAQVRRGVGGLPRPRAVVRSGGEGDRRGSHAASWWPRRLAA